MLIRALHLIVIVLFLAATLTGQSQLAPPRANANPDSLLLRVADFKLIAGDLK
jgi:hypothetical protein